MQPMYGHPLHDMGRLDDAALLALLRMLADTHWRVAVTGRPGIGKTSLVRRLMETRNGVYIFADTVVEGVDWKDQAKEVVRVGGTARSWVMEGVAVARALRHGLEADVVLHLDGKPHKAQSAGAVRLGNQVSGWVAEVYGKYPIYRAEVGK